MKRALLMLAIASALVGVLSAADLTGKWTGQFDFNGDTVPLTFTLKHSGSTLTGTVSGLPTDPAEIKEGKVDGNTVTFWLLTDYQGTTFKVLYTGKIAEDHIDFTMATEGGEFTVNFPVKKATP